MSSIAEITKALQAVLIHEADRLARETGFVQRQVKWSGHTFIQTLVMGFLANPDASYSELSQSAVALGVNVSNQGLEQRFTPAAVLFVRQILETMIAQVIRTQWNPFPVLDSFRGVHIRDSSVITLPKSLQEVWRGVGGSAGETSALKLQVSLDFQTGQVHGPVLQDGRAPDQSSPFQAECLPAGALQLADLGYFSLDRLAADQAAGVFWITRYKLGTRVFGPDGQQLALASWLQTRSTMLVESAVSLGEKHRLPCRFIALRVPQEVADRRRQALKEWARKKQKPVSAERLKLAEWTLVVTNVSAEQLPAHDVLALLRMRWQVELLFKLWKSHGKVDEWRSQNPWRILCEIYAKLIGLTLSQWLFAVSLWSYPDRSLFQAANTIRQWATTLALAIQNPAQLLATLTTLCNCLSVGCRQQKRRTHAAAFQLLLSLR